jgi:vesicle coat complex subunit
MSVAPLNAVVLSIVAHNLRSPAMTFQIFTIHLLGDLPSPTLVAQAIHSGKKYVTHKHTHTTLTRYLQVLILDATT